MIMLRPHTKKFGDIIAKISGTEIQERYKTLYASQHRLCSCFNLFCHQVALQTRVFIMSRFFYQRRFDAVPFLSSSFTRDGNLVQNHCRPFFVSQCSETKRPFACSSGVKDFDRREMSSKNHCWSKFVQSRQRLELML